MPTSRRTRRLLWAVCAAVVLAASATSMGAGAADSANPREERAEARRQKAEVAGQVDSLRATNADLSSALATLDANVATLEGQLGTARAAVEKAEAESAQAAAELEQAEAEAEELRRSTAAAAVDAYVRPPSEDRTDALLSDEINDMPVRRALIDSQQAQAGDLLDQYRAAKEDLAAKRDEADAASAAAQHERDALESRVTELESARAEKRQLAADVDTRLDSALAESASLEELDASLSRQIAADQEALARQAKAAAAAPPPSSGGGDSGPAPVIPGPIGGIVSVRGIMVSSSIAGQLEGLLSAASAAGFNLSGGGYRDPSAQIETRKRNCGTSNYAIYHMPPSQCSPPTARPGQSMHEQGLAIDFTHNGSIISSRSSAAFQWLASNAGGFGFRNLPSEPWHWSTNGN
jgi:hypothetical protein